MFLVQECFESDISKLIHDAHKVTLTEQHITTIVYNILCALHFVHSAQIVHRDIKSSNILINGDCNVRICDFGLARAVVPKPDPIGNSDDLESLSTGEVTLSGKKLQHLEQPDKPQRIVPLSPRVGSRFYRAPELVLCYQEYNQAVDIWSVGCILGELLMNFIEKQDSSKDKSDKKMSNKSCMTYEQQ